MRVLGLFALFVSASPALFSIARAIPRDLAARQSVSVGTSDLPFSSITGLIGEDPVSDAGDALADTLTTAGPVEPDALGVIPAGLIKRQSDSLLGAGSLSSDSISISLKKRDDIDTLDEELEELEDDASLKKRQSDNADADADLALDNDSAGL